MKVYIVSYHFRSTEILAAFLSREEADKYRLRLATDEAFSLAERSKPPRSCIARRAADEFGTVMFEELEIRDGA